MFIMEIKSPIILEPVQWPVLDSLNKHISIIKQLQLSKILLQIVATQTHVYILILCHYRLNAYYGNAIYSHAGIHIRTQDILNI
jgi:hypothetical protein